MKVVPAAVWLAALMHCGGPLADEPACPPEGWSAEALGALQADRWKLEDDERRRALAIGLLGCLASPDPQWRDAYAFEAISAWMRGGALTVDTAREIGERTLAMLRAPDDAAGFARPFAALVLSEVARADRLKPLWSPEEREAVASAAARFLRDTRDYRGFDAGEGWRHAVAHGADLAMQLSLNPQLSKAQLDRLLDSVAAQAVPPAAHFYIYGEGERLAAPVFYAARRNLHLESEWAAFIRRIAEAATPVEGAPFSQAALARLHDAKAFLLPLYASLHEAPDEPWRRKLLAPVTAALRSLP